MRVFIVAAISADGFIGHNTAQSSLEWRSKADADFFIGLTKEAGVMVMGSNTYNTFKIKKAPPGRRLIVYSYEPSTVKGENVEATQEKPADLITRLEKEGASAIAVCGGAQINKLFIDSGLVNEVYLTVEPVFMGQGVPLFAGELHTHLKLLESKQLAENTVLLHYAVGE